MASRFIYSCGCVECGDLTYPCKDHSEVKINLTEETRIVDPNTGGEKGSKLARFDLIPPDALWKLAEVYGKGSQKYTDRNWEKGFAWGLSIAALERHLSLFKQREDIDPETQCHHIAQVAWHALTLLTFQLRGLGTDDRSQMKEPK